MREKMLSSQQQSESEPAKHVIHVERRKPNATADSLADRACCMSTVSEDIKPIRG